MRRFHANTSALAAAVVALSASYVSAEEFTAKLSGFNEIGSIPTAFPAIASTPSPSSPSGYTGAILTDATGKLSLKLSKDHIDYTLTYTGPFSSDVQQAHIHFGKSRDSGGIVVWLCQTTVKMAPTQVVGITPFCTTAPNPTATVTGTITMDNVLAVPTQNILTAKDFDAITDAITSNTAYVNIHTANFPGGEIRGQIHSEEEDQNHGQNRQ